MDCVYDRLLAAAAPDLVAQLAPNFSFRFVMPHFLYQKYIKTRIVQLSNEVVKFVIISNALQTSVSSAVAVVGAEIPTIIDSRTVWEVGGVQTVEKSMFLLSEGEIFPEVALVNTPQVSESGPFI